MREWRTSFSYALVHPLKQTKNARCPTMEHSKQLPPDPITMENFLGLWEPLIKKLCFTKFSPANSNVHNVGTCQKHHFAFLSSFSLKSTESILKLVKNKNGKIRQFFQTFYKARLSQTNGTPAPAPNQICRFRPQNSVATANLTRLLELTFRVWNIWSPVN